jgi:hypothetical protein
MTGYVYALWEGNENNVTYIGSSIDPKSRAKQHEALNTARVKAEEEITHLSPHFKRYKYFIIEQVEFEERGTLLDAEVYWIHQFIEWGFKLQNGELYKHYRYGTITVGIGYMPVDVYKIIQLHRPHKRKQDFLNAMYSFIRDQHKELQEQKIISSGAPCTPEG